MPEEWVQVLIGPYEQIRSGSLASVTDGVQQFLGRAPRDFSDYVKSTAAQGVWEN